MSVNEFYRCSERVQELLRHREFNRVFGRRSKEARDIFRKCIADMEKMAAGTRIIGDTELVKRIVDVLLDKVTREYVSPFLYELCEKGGLLLYNWNQSIENTSESLAIRIRAIDRLVKSHYTMLDAIQVLRNLTRRPYIPAAYELSKHYLEAIRNQDKKA